MITIVILSMILVIFGNAQHQSGGTNETNIRNEKTCKISRELYKKHIGLRYIGKGDDYKTCLQPGCFYIFKQDNLGWSNWASSLFSKSSSSKKKPGDGNKEHDDTEALMGCRYDIPYLIQRTHGSSDKKLHKMLKMLRACFVGDLNEVPPPLSFCQPEYDGTAENSTIGATHGSGNGIAHANNNTWVGRHLQIVQEKCFYKFISGIFFVRVGKKKQLVVCCTEGGKDDNEIKEKCRKITGYINEKGWRKEIDN